MTARLQTALELYDEACGKVREHTQRADDLAWAGDLQYAAAEQAKATFWQTEAFRHGRRPHDEVEPNW